MLSNNLLWADLLSLDNINDGGMLSGIVGQEGRLKGLATEFQRTARAKHRTYAQNERRIRESVLKAVAERNISTRVSDICKQASLSTPTFYLHHKNCNEVLSSYEGELLVEFEAMLLKDFNRIDIFSSLLLFMWRHQRYFWACFASQNLYLLTRLLLGLQKYLVGPGVGRKTYVFYCSSIMALLIWWGRVEMFSKELIPEYTRQLKNLRLVYYK